MNYIIPTISKTQQKKSQKDAKIDTLNTNT